MTLDPTRRKLRCELQRIGECIQENKPKDFLSLAASRWQATYLQALSLHEDVEKIQTLFNTELQKLLHEPLYNEPFRDAVLGQDNVTYDPLLLRLWTHETGLQGVPSKAHPIVRILIAYRNTCISPPASSPKYEEALALIRNAAIAKQASRSQRLQNMIAQAKQEIAEEMTHVGTEIENIIQKSERAFDKSLSKTELSEQKKYKTINETISRLETSATELDLEAKKVEKETKDIRGEIELAKNEVHQLDCLVQEAKQAIQEQGGNNIFGALGTIIVCCGATYGLSGLGSGMSLNPLPGGAKLTLGFPI